MEDVTKGVSDVTWSDVYYDQAASLVDFLLDRGIDVKWCGRERLVYIKTCLRDMARMNMGEDIWDYGERSVQLSLSREVESDVYRLVSEYGAYGFSFDDTEEYHSLMLLDAAEIGTMVRDADEGARNLQHDRKKMKRRARDNMAATCLGKYLGDCRKSGLVPTMDGYAKACGSRRIGRKIWRRYMA